MNRLRMMLSESARSLTANLSTTVAATVTVLIAMFLLGVFIAVGSWGRSFGEEAKERLRVKVYMCTRLTCEAEATDKQVNDVRNHLQGLARVKDVRFITKDEAYEIMLQRTPELVENVSSNPFPHTFEVTPTDADDVLLVSDEIRDANLAGVEKVKDGRQTATRILDYATALSIFFFVIVLILAVAAALLISNTIRLSIFSRRREIEVMKLVGATNWFVRGPFMIEGLLCGLGGALAAILLLLLGKVLVVDRLLDRFDDATVNALGFTWNALILVAFGLALGALGSGMTLRRFLKV